MAQATEYNDHIQAIRDKEYPMLKDQVYLDHAGTTLYSKTLMETFSRDMITNLYGNPHSASSSSQLSSRRIDDIRLKALRFFNADPEYFDLIFVANATAAIKLVMDTFRSLPGGFSYFYHQDAHTSMVGVRENAADHMCLGDDDIEAWLLDPSLHTPAISTQTRLFAYPAQSNLNGRRLPLTWSSAIRKLGSPDSSMYSMLDAAALVSTAPLDLSCHELAPDFTALSFNKIFGFPDLGALIVRKQSGHIFQARQYFGGGTVDAVVCDKYQSWHRRKEQSLHEILEDGTLPIHNIFALDTAMNCHMTLFESMRRISDHTTYLARLLYHTLKDLCHANGRPCCRMYSQTAAFNAGNTSQGPVIAFNIQDAQGQWHSNAEVEKLAAVKGIHIRTGGLCNPGGVAQVLNLSSSDILANYAAGIRCGSDNDIMSNGNPTGIIRASIGAMSTLADIDAFCNFIREFYVESVERPSTMRDPYSSLRNRHYIKKLTVYPIKSCGGYSIPDGTDWEVRPEGLAWDREWCLVHQGTGQALSQKRYPRMVLIRPSIDFESGMLQVKFTGSTDDGSPNSISVPLVYEQSQFLSSNKARVCSSRVCGDNITANLYTDTTINDFFSNILGISCALARFPAGGMGTSARHSKAHLQRYQKPSSIDCHSTGKKTPLPTPPDSGDEDNTRPILLSNESPILVINTLSLDFLNSAITASGGKSAHESVFRANVVISPMTFSQNQSSKPYMEDSYTSMTISNDRGQSSTNVKMLGACRRCHMVCVDQDTALKNEEPFVTLTKTRRFDGGVFFGVHAVLQKSKHETSTIRVGDLVEGFL